MVADTRHVGILGQSNEGVIRLNEALYERFCGVCELYLKVKGIELNLPKSLDTDLFLWRTMSVRFRKGDLRNSKDEEKAMQRIADWTMQVNCELRNQEYVPLEWKET